MRLVARRRAIVFAVVALAAVGLGAAAVEPSLILKRAADRDAFRRWFTFLAEAQYYTPVAQRPAEITDCSSLVRYAYREALRQHDSVWAAESRLPLIAAIPSIAQYNYPHTPTGAKLFQTGPHAFGEFANAETLYRYNTFFVTRQLRRAEPGDLLFYRHGSGRMPFHTMIVLGHSQIKFNSAMYVVYDTGPEGTDQGEIKRLSYEELLHFPDAQWQPRAQNPLFLGVFRWNILKDTP